MLRPSPPAARRLTAALLVPVGLVVLALSLAASTAIGAADLGPGDVLGVVVDRLGGPPSDLSELRQRIILDLRLPRAVLAAACGAGLALCGVVLQSLLRNPLADPFVLGVSSGASTGAVLVVVLGVGAGAVGLASGAFLGAVVAFALVLLLGHLTGGGAGASTDRMILAGVASTQLFAALTSFVVFTAADPEQTRGVLFWLLGSLGAATWTEVVVCGLVVLAGIAVCAARRRARSTPSRSARTRHRASASRSCGSGCCCSS
ncbi:MAG: iron chelate uptake ABC transporter family permease subunit [Aeromicrobium erythreum]